MKIFLDFDDTLFDTTRTPGKFWEDLVVIIEGGGWKREEIEETAESFSGSAFDRGMLYHYRSHMELLEKKYPHGKLNKTLLRIQGFMENLEGYLFLDAVPFFNQMRREDVFIITYGDEDFQKAKIIGSGIDRLVTDILVTQGESKIAMILRYVEEKKIPKNEKIVFIDDKAKYFDDVNKSQYIVKKILIDRGRKNSGQENVDYVVQSFQEVAKILQNL